MLEITSFYQELAASEHRVAERQAQSQNGVRNAMSYHQPMSTGTGTIRWDTPVDFDVTFIAEPVFVAGSTVVTQPSPDRFTDPVGQAQVWRWLRNARGFYLGAYMTFYVTDPEPKSDPVLAKDPEQGAKEDAQLVRIVHQLSFNGMAYKPLSPEVALALETITPRRVGGFS